MCPDGWTTYYIDSPSIKCGVIVVLRALVRKIWWDVYVFVHARRVRPGVLIPGHKLIEQYMQRISIVDAYSLRESEVRYLFHAFVV